MFLEVFKSLSKGLLTLGATAIMAFSSTAMASSPSTSFSYSSGSGDWVGQGRSQVFQASASTQFTVRGTSELVTISVNSTSSSNWSVSLAAPAGEKLHPGVYSNAERVWTRSGRSAGIDVSGNGRSCNKIWGSFIVNQVGFNSAGKVTKLDASFTQSCESAKAPALTGTIKYNALPLYATLNSTAGDYIGGGISKSFYNSTSLFTLSGNASRAQYSASGNRSNFDALIAAPKGKVLAPGNYVTTRFGDATHAGLDVSSDGRGCNASTGTLSIKAMTRDKAGNIVGLSATFVQYCDKNTVPLKGVIRYFE